MPRSTLVSRWIALVGTVWATAGCPALLDDGFRKVPARPDGGAAQGSGGDMQADASGAGGLVAGGGAGGSANAAGGATSGGGPGDGSAGATSNGGTVGDGAPEGGDPCARCRPSEACCDGRCSDLDTNERDCGACGTGCPGTTCIAGSCTNTCALGFVDCNRNVVDGCEVNAAVDPENCGNCDIACAFQQTCEGGNCRCPEATENCDGFPENGCETDITSDPKSCGQCGTVCGDHQECILGRCECATGFGDCNTDPRDGCEASFADPGSCGSCTLDCGPNRECSATGTCGCVEGYLNCDLGIPGCETAVTDPQHCGTCPISCAPAAPACDGTQCVVGCGTLTRCGSSCVDLMTSAEHCGTCGRAVGVDQECVGGAPRCAPGFGDCDSSPGDCETVTASSLTHCGACNSPCKPGAICSGGVCACAPATPNDCGAACRECCSASQCSDGNSCTTETCSAAGQCTSGASCAGGGVCCAGQGCFECCGDTNCPSGRVCSSNRCVVPTCNPPSLLCDLRCVDPSTDAANCGGCGNACGPGRTCSAGACTPKWVALAAPPAGFVAREKAAYTAFGSKVFMWGGADALGLDRGDGAVYDVATDTWADVATDAQTPSARVLATAVWTGTHVVVWGGGSALGLVDHRTGGRYDPQANVWLPISTAGAPTARRAAYGVWTGSRVFFWSGANRFGSEVDGAYLYDPATDSWSTASTNDAPKPALDVTSGWTGTSFLKYGGSETGSSSDEAFGHRASTDVWTKYQSGPSKRRGAFGTWDGSYLLVWSGRDDSLKTDGRVFDPVANAWSGIATSNGPSARWAPHRRTGWSARIATGVTLVLGGEGATTSTVFTNGGVYNSTTNAWATVVAWPSASAHLWGVGVWTGTEFVLWGGRPSPAGPPSLAGERYRP